MLTFDSLVHVGVFVERFVDQFHHLLLDHLDLVVHLVHARDGLDLLSHDAVVVVTVQRVSLATYTAKIRLLETLEHSLSHLLGSQTAAILKSRLGNTFSLVSYDSDYRLLLLCFSPPSWLC